MLDRLFGKLLFKIGDGIEFAEKGSVVECVSRKESKNPKTTAKLTIGKKYEISDIRFYGCLQRGLGWGYITVRSDVGAIRCYPLHRFKYDEGVKRKMGGEEVFVCAFCLKRTYYTSGTLAPMCPCSVKQTLQSMPFDRKPGILKIDMQPFPERGIFEAIVSDGSYQAKISLEASFVNVSTTQEIKEYLIDIFTSGRNKEMERLGQLLQQGIVDTDFLRQSMGYVAPQMPRVLPSKPAKSIVKPKIDPTPPKPGQRKIQI